MKTPSLRRPAAGFSFVELLVVIAIVGILAAMAYPSYTRYGERTRRAAARAVLLEAAQFMERFYAGANTYEGAVLPDRLTMVPTGAVAAEAAYAVSAIRAASSTYTLRALPLRDDPCGSLTLDEAGTRGRDGTDLTVEACWR